MINKALQILSTISSKISSSLKIRTDLIMHFIVSFMICCCLSLIFMASLWGIILTMIIGIGKEIYDVFKVNPTGFDLLDLLADLLGAGVGYLLILLII